MGSIAGGAKESLLGLAAWAAIVASAYAGARFTLRRVATGRREKLLEIANELGKQIAESTASLSDPTDPRRKIGSGR